MNYYRCCGGSEKVTIDGEKVKDKLELQSFVVEHVDFADAPERLTHNGAFLLNNELYIACSYNKTLYKWDGNTWTQVGTLPSYWNIENALVVLNGEVHAFGLLENNNYRCHYKWDGTTWTRVSTLPYIFCAGMAVVLNGEIHILGGRNPYGSSGGGAHEYYYANHYKWDGTAWTQVSTLPRCMWSGSAVVLNGEIHVLGGYLTANAYSSASSYSKEHYVWNGSSWIQKRYIPYSIVNPSAVVLDDEIHVLGGSAYNDNSALISKKKHCKCVSDSFTEMSDLPYDTDINLGAVVLNGRIHMLSSQKHYLVTPTVYASPI